MGLRCSSGYLNRNMFGNDHFHDTFRKAALIFGNLFNDVTVYRFDKNGTKIQSIAVPLEFGPRQKTITRVLSNPDFDKPTSTIVPRMSFQFAGLTPNRSLQLQKTQSYARLVSDDRGKTVRTQFMPVPHQLGVELSIYSKNTYDAYQILEGIVPYFSPEWSVSANFIPEMDYVEDVKIVLTDTNLTDNFEVAEFEGRRMIVHTLNFTMNVPFFGPVKRSGLIKRVNLNFYTPPGSGEVTNFDIANTPAVLSYELVPGLTANGEPTANVAESVHYTMIDPDDPYGFCETWTDWTTGRTVTGGERLTNDDARDLISTSRATAQLVYGDSTAAPYRVQEITTSGSALTIDLAYGQYVILNLQHEISSLTFKHWIPNILSKATIEIRNNGAGDILDWGIVDWTEGQPPTLTVQAGGRDILMLHTADAGTTVYGTIVGLNYS